MLAEVFGTDLFVLVLVVASLGVPVWAIVDASRCPEAAFHASGSNKTGWIVVLVAATCLGVGLFLGAFYLLFSRPKVHRQMG